MRPRVVVNMAMSADGKTDSIQRRGARISSTADIERVQRLRAESDAVMVGGRTFLDEDPRLTVRRPDLVARRLALGLPGQPMKVAVVSRLPDSSPGAASPSLSAFLGDGGGRAVIFTSALSAAADMDCLHAAGAEVVVLGESRVDLAAGLAWLHGAGVRSLLVEGGGTLVAALLAGDLVDEIRLYVAPMILGGAAAPTPVDGPGIRRGSAVEMHLEEFSADPDGGLLLRYKVLPGPAERGARDKTDSHPIVQTEPIG